jgi:RHS repeat-associated protein
VLSQTDARGKTTSMGYDTIGRLQTITYPTGTPTTLEYDGGATPYPGAAGELTKITDESGSTSYSYDSAGRLTSKTSLINGKTFTVGYGWGDSGSAIDKLTSITYPSGTRVNYSYDAQGYTTAITVSPVNPNGVGTGTAQNLLSAITYIADNQLTGWLWANGKGRSIGYDTYGQIASYNLGDATGTGISAGSLRSVVRDGAGRITGYSHSTAAVPNQSFGYDNLNRLTNATLGTTTTQYSYDATGNRTSKTIGSTTYTNTVAPDSNKYTQTQDVTGTAAVQYDAAGHITADGANTFTYSDRGRMATASNAGGTVNYSYNALELRVAKTGPTALIPTGASYYVYDEQGQLLGEYDANNNPLYETIYLGNTPVGVLKQTGSAQSANIATSIYNVYSDHLNTARVITRASDNAMVWRWDAAEAFGATAPDQNPSNIAIFSYNPRLPGQTFDKETGLNQNWNREYDPRQGRYRQSDPIGLAGGINTYAYVEGNPLSGVDPRGLNTVYWGGAGLRGAYVESQVRALQEAGISNVRSSTVGGGGNLALDANAVVNLRSYPPQYGYLTPWAPYDGAPKPYEQNNYVGYSYGSLLAAQTAMHYANRGCKIDNLVLIGSPISSEFLYALRNNKNIKNVLVKNLGFNGDPIRAGMSEADLLLAIPIFALDVAKLGAGHFYYSGNDATAAQRHRDLARELYKAGLR